MAAPPASSVTRLITPSSKSLGEFHVRRSLPDKAQQRVGPFIFFDHMGPADFLPGTGVDVRPHPHIGIATITYLFAGAIRHRDSLGVDQVILPGAVNWMTAGRGVVHSERTPAELRHSGSHLHGIQAWIALPLDAEECEPGFVHYPAEDIPLLRLPGASLRLIAGAAYDAASGVKTASDTLYLEVNLEPGATLALPDSVDELAVYAVDGELDVGGQPVAGGTLAVLPGKSGITLRARSRCKCKVLGGATLAGERILWWNFVSSSRQRIDKAKDDWRNGRFDPVPGETEFIPLPAS